MISEFIADRFIPPTDPEPEPWAVCEACGEDIFCGEDALELNGSIVHDDLECLVKHAGAMRIVAGEWEME